MWRSMMIGLCVLSLWGPSVQAIFKENTHYEYVKIPEDKQKQLQALLEQAKSVVLVLEFFNYGCYGCYLTEPVIPVWKSNLPSNVAFRQVPVTFTPDWALYARFFYALDFLKADPKVHQAFFEALHKKGQYIRTIEDAAQFLLPIFPEKNLEALRALLNSYQITEALQIANEESYLLQVTAVPQWVVIGPKGVVHIQHASASGPQELLSIVDKAIALQLASLQMVARG